MMRGGGRKGGEEQRQVGGDRVEGGWGLERRGLRGLGRDGARWAGATD